MTDQQATPQPAAPPTALEIEQDDYSKYLLYSRSEILFVLRSVLQKSCMLTVYFDNGQRFFLTALLAISEDGNWLYFDPGSDEAINKLALKADKLLLTTMLEKVKIQFTVNGLQATKAGTRTALAGRLPETMLRLQRREYFRLSTPIGNPLKCSLRIPQADGSSTSLESVVLDISGGGLGLQLPSGLPLKFEPGMVFPDCRLNLPEEGLLVTTLCVRNAFEVSTRSGHQYLRVGCEYVDLPGTRLSMIQRYITRVERDRKSRANGSE